MKLAAHIFLLAAATCAAETEKQYKCGQTKFPPEKINHDGHERIVGGTDVPQGKYPWLVDIRYKQTNWQSCTATLVSRTYLLIAAHCVVDIFQPPLYPLNDPNDYYAVAGHVDINSPDAKRIGLKRFIKHPQFYMNDYKDAHFPRHTDGGATNDVALIELEEPLPFTDTIQPICVSGKHQTSDPEYNVVLTGWGNIKNITDPQEPKQFTSILQETRARVAENQTCKRKYTAYDPQAMICFTGIDGTYSSSGDSGGPALVHVDDSQNGYWSQIGVTSYGGPRKPDVYTRVSNYCKWIQENSNGEVVCKN